MGQKFYKWAKLRKEHFPTHYGLFHLRRKKSYTALQVTKMMHALGWGLCNFLNKRVIHFWQLLQKRPKYCEGEGAISQRGVNAGVRNTQGRQETARGGIVLFRNKSCDNDGDVENQQLNLRPAAGQWLLIKKRWQKNWRWKIWSADWVWLQSKDLQICNKNLSPII